MTRDADGTKWLTAARLAELLAELPPDARLLPNRVGNLLVLSSDGERSIAYIDFLLEGSIETMEET